MKRLVLLRHAKAVPAAPDLDDADRRLAGIGRSDAVRMGQYLKDEGLVPGLVLCSAAVRTRETLECVLPQLGALPEIRLLPDLYLARWLSILNLIQQHGGTMQTLMVIGHNPGLEECARRLARPPADAQGRKLQQLLEYDYPPAAATALEFDIEDWVQAERNEGDLLSFTRPRDFRGPE